MHRRFVVFALTILLRRAAAVPVDVGGGPPLVHTQYGGQLEHNPAARADAYKCEVCLTVVNRHGESAPGSECNGLEFYHEICAEVVQAFIHWGRWINTWLDEYGCHKVTPVGLALAKPCPGHAVCSWVTSPFDREPYCPNDFTYKSPQTQPQPPVEHSLT
jgi:hypothetical protein